MMTQPTIGFIGLGAMGLPMATVLVKDGFTVYGYDITSTAVDAFVEAGGNRADTVADAAQTADVLYVMVVNAEQARAVLDEATKTLKKGAVVIIGSTITPADAQLIASQLEAQGYLMIDAPVSGGVVGATAATLSVMASGPASAFEIAQPVLESIGGNVFNLGEENGNGSTVKVINQLLCGVHIAATAEALALGVKAGMDSQQLFDVITKSAGTSWMFENRGPHMIQNDYTPHSAVDIFVKDLGIVLGTGKDNKFPVPLASTALQLFTMASAAGYGRLDDAAIVKVYEMLTGVDVTGEAYKNS